MAMNQEELLKAFVDEALEHLSTIEADFLDIEKSGKDIDSERINKVFRAAHSIKGGAGFIGLPKIRDLAHAIETVLGKFRNRTLVPNQDIISLLLAAVDLLRRMVIDVTDHEDVDIAGILMRLKSVLDTNQESPVPTSLIAPSTTTDPNTTPQPTLPEPEKAVGASAVRTDIPKDQPLYRIVLHPETDSLFVDRNPNDVIQEIAGYGTLVSIQGIDSPGAGQREDQPPSSDGIEIVLSCVLEQEDLALLLEIAPERIVRLRPDGSLQPQSSSPTLAPDGSNPQPTTPPSKDRLFQQFAAHPSRVQESDVPLQFPKPTGKGPSGSSAKEAADPDATRDSSHGGSRARHSDGSTQSIRVQIGVLDSLIDLAGELVLSRNQLLKTLSQSECARLQTLAKRLDLITSDLQHVILKTRMRPIGDLFHRFPRLVRDIAVDLGKEVVLELEGADVELDRTVIEAINDPLLHMLRNAVDHGIEPPEVRKTLGKPTQGRIVLSASSQGGQVILDIQDDGKGMDPEQIARSAVQKGFLTEEQARMLGRSEKMRLVFAAGMSTSDAVTQWSGRGVGLDVVKANVEQFGGSIDIDTAPNQGTRFRIKLPLTLAIIASQLVCVEGHRFAIPQVHVEELIRIPAHQVKHRIEVIGNAEVLRLRGDLLPLVRLSDLLKIERTYVDPTDNLRKPDRRFAIADRRSKRISPGWNASEDTEDQCLSQPDSKPSATPIPGNPFPRSCPDRRYRVSSTLHILVIATGGMRYGLIVDAFDDFEEIVVKPLGKHYRTARIFSGATILGDGSIALILDVNQIPLLARLHQIEVPSGEARLRRLSFSERSTAAAVAMEDRLHLIVFRNFSEEAVAVPIHSVQRILRCKTKEIRWIAGRPALSLDGQDLRLIPIDEAPERLQEHPDEPWVLIVFRACGRTLGLMGKGPIDTMLTHQRIDGVSFRKPGIIGTIRIHETTILLLDLIGIVQGRYPEWFAAGPEVQRRPPPEEKILLVEDSDFFRDHVASILREAGYRVVTAADGRQGYDLLQEKARDIALVVTDIEMPRMNGLELIRLIRSDDRLRHLPIVALTTLADDTDRQRAVDAGVNDYQIKLDRESLLASIAEWIQRSVPEQRPMKSLSKTGEQG